MRGLKYEIFLLVYNLRVSGEAVGTGFYMPVQDKGYLVTAKHVLETAENAKLELFVSGGWCSLDAKAIRHPDPCIDIAALDISHVGPRPAPSVKYTCHGVALSGEAYFLGFPYGLQNPFGPMKGNPLPLAKKAIVCGTATNEEGKPIGFYLDGHCNPGFSGGPCVIQGVDGSWRIFGVVSNYLQQEEVLCDTKGQRRMILLENSGIFVCHSIDQMMDYLRTV
jgi:hypothetical protein